MAAPEEPPSLMGDARSWHPAFRPDHESPRNATFVDAGHLAVARHDDEGRSAPSESDAERPRTPITTTTETLQNRVPQSPEDYFKWSARANHGQLATTIPDSIHGSSRTNSSPTMHSTQEIDDPWGQAGAGEDYLDGMGSTATGDSQLHAQPEPYATERASEQMYEHQCEPHSMEAAFEDSEKPLLLPADGESQARKDSEPEVPLQVQPNHLSAALNVYTPDADGLDLATQEPQWPDVAAAVFSTDESQLASRDTHLVTDISHGQRTAPMIEPSPAFDISGIPSNIANEPSADGWGPSEDSPFNLTASAGSDIEIAPANDIDAWANAFGDDDFLPDSDAAAAFGFDDGEGFLEDEPSAVASLERSAEVILGQRPHARSISSAKYTPSNAPQPHLATARDEAYRPGGLNLIDSSKAQTYAASTTRAPAPSPYSSAYHQPIQRPAISSAESFADKAKGGYHSPYDLPDDIAIKKRKPSRQTQLPAMGVTEVAPPPRSSSMNSVPLTGVATQPQIQSNSAILQHSTVPHQLLQGRSGTPNEAQSASRQASGRDMGFFADLPVVQRPSRQGTPSGRYNLQPGAAPAPVPLAPPAVARPASLSYIPSPSTQQAPSMPDLPNLRRAETMPLYSQELQTQPRSIAVPPAPTTRYSPAVPSATNPVESRYSPAPPLLTSNSSRYSPAPASKPLPGPSIRDGQGGAPPRQAQSYAPRTSSPLAFHRAASPEQLATNTPPQVSYQQDPHGTRSRTSIDRMGSMIPGSALETVNENAEPMFSPPSRPEGPQQPPPSVSRNSTPPPPRSNPSSAVSSPRKRGNYAPTNYQPVDFHANQGVVPPRRSQTSSPNAAFKVQHPTLANLDRPASVAALQSPAQPSFPHTNRMKSSLTGPAYHELKNLTGPYGDMSEDPLQRWKGAPIFHWGNGNSIITTFPRYTPEYGGGQMAIRPTPGLVKSQNLTELCPQSDLFLKFPGPLKKGKKKEVLAWLKSSVETLETEHKMSSMNGEFTTALHTRSEERILLSKVICLLVEHDGSLEGTPTVEAAVRALITPVLPEEPTPADGFEPSSVAQPEGFDPQAVKALRRQLYAGEREKAVWHAVDQRLWAHALLIASTLNNKDIWKQVVQEFVRKEVRRSGDNTEALAALYQVFAGNWEESIDELVPVSARSGFQMVSTSNAGALQKDALAGLDQWRETLLLILNNRSAGDPAALASLGNLLNGYGRIEAGHICFLFARNAAKFGSADDEQSHYTLIGGSKTQQGLDFGKSLDTILLSEVYEFAMMLGSGPALPVPHLQAYKLYHAEVLAEAGKRTEAQQYCDTITGIATAKANRSPFYNTHLMKWLDDFARRLSQAPADKSDSSWKPSIDKVSSSIWGKFNTFIAGESEDIATATFPGAGVEPVNSANTTRAVPMMTGHAPPSLTRAASDIYPHNFVNTSVTPTLPSQSRYAPSGNYTPRTSSEQARPKYESQSQSAYQPRNSSDSSYGIYEPRASFEHGFAATPQTTAPSSSHSNSSQHAAMGQPLTDSFKPYSADGPSQRPANSSYVPSPLYNVDLESELPAHLPTPPAEPPSYPLSDQALAPMATGLNSHSHVASITDTPQLSSYEPSASSFGYEPPVSSYEPPSYRSYEDDAAADTSEGQESNVKKKSFMDDDNDDEISFAAQNEAMKKKQKAEADRVAEERFKEAAEADADKADKGKETAAGNRQTWFGGWFGGKKDPNAPTIYKAKLGDESSFYFDKDLNKWVNKKGGADASTTNAATPPPPRALAPSRPSTGHSSTPPLGAEPPSLGSRSSTPAIPLSGMAPPPLRSASSSSIATAGPVAALQGSGGPPSRPPSRPGTSMSNISDIDDLLGPAAPRRGAAKKTSARKGRYVDVMAQKN